MPNEKGWYVVRPNNRKSSLFASKEAAIAKAERELAEDQGELFVFDKTGRLVNKSAP